MATKNSTHLIVFVLTLLYYDSRKTCMCSTYTRSGSSLTTVPASDIPEATTHLDLSNNIIGVMQDADFTNTTELKFINASHNVLTTFPSYGPSTANVTTLLLSVNRITIVSATDLEPFTALVTLHLVSNRLTEFLTDPGLPVGNSIELLNLQKNSISVILNDTFVGFHSLRELDIGQNYITTFPNFTGVEDTLIKLEMQGNKLTNIPQELLKPLQSLAYLYLGSNQLVVFPNLTVVASTLKSFGMYGNPLPDVPGDILDTLVNLESINLEKSTLTVLPNLGQSCQKLDELDFSYGNISVVNPESFIHCNSLRWLYINYNNLRTFPNLTCIRNTMDIIQLNGNSISEISPDVLEGLGVKRLQLSYNNLSSLPDLTPLSSTLTELFIENNVIQSVNPDILVSLNNLERLVLDGNQLKSFPNVNITPTASLKNLSLQYNQLTEFPQLDAVGVILEELLLEGNPDIRYMHSSHVTRLTHLKRLSICGTSVETIPDLSSHVVHGVLNTLDLSRHMALTPVRTIHPRTAAVVGRLRRFMLRRTAVQLLGPACPDPAVGWADQKLYVDGDDGLRLCDCSMLWLKHAQLAGIYVTVSDVWCDALGKLWSDASLEELEAALCQRPGGRRAGCMRGMLTMSAAEDTACPQPVGPIIPGTTLMNCSFSCQGTPGCQSFNFRPSGSSRDYGDCMLVTPSPEAGVLEDPTGWQYYVAGDVQDCED